MYHILIASRIQNKNKNRKRKGTLLSCHLEAVFLCPGATVPQLSQDLPECVALRALWHLCHQSVCSTLFSICQMHQMLEGMQQALSEELRCFLVFCFCFFLKMPPASYLRLVLSCSVMSSADTLYSIMSLLDAYLDFSKCKAV